jgi:hypothetical protein
VSTRSQRGITMVVSLIMLLMLTTFGISMIRLSTSNQRIALNMEAQRGAEAAAQQVIEESLNSQNFFLDQINLTGPWTAGATTTTQTVNGYNVTLHKPQCLLSRPAPGYSGVSPVAPNDVFWEVRAVATHPTTGATADVTQGVFTVLPADNCIWP